MGDDEVEVMGITDILKKQTRSNTVKGEKKISEIISEMFHNYFDPDDIREKTELTPDEVNTFTKLQVYKQMLKIFFNHDAPYVNKLVDEKYHLTISSGRKGRSEVTKTMQAFSMMKAKEEEDEQSILKRLFTERVS